MTAYIISEDGESVIGIGMSGNWKNLPDDDELVIAYHNNQAWTMYKVKAQIALDRTDIVALRCFKAGVEFPLEWKEYVESLRSIVRTQAGDATQPLPEQPTYPDGT